MDRIAAHAFAFSLCLGLAAGCGKSGTADKAPSTGGPAKVVQAPPPDDPAGRVAYDFLDAVLKGDDQKVTACLTPQAIQRLIESHKRFALPGVDSTTFRIGEVRKTESQALVQCFLSDASQGKEDKSEEICCLVRQIDREWRVSGIAVMTGPGRPPMILDFESPPTEPMGLPTSPQVSNQPAAPQPGGRPSPRTADDAPVSTIR
jgi:hypothetical protein